MPGPTTEVLSDDLKEVRSDLHKVEVALAAEIHKVDNSVTKLGAEFAVFKWLLGATLATTLAGVVSSAYWAGSLASRVTSLEARVDKVDSRLDRINGHLEQIESRLDRIEASITKAIGRADGNGASNTPKR